MIEWSPRHIESTAQTTAKREAGGRLDLGGQTKPTKRGGGNSWGEESGAVAHTGGESESLAAASMSDVSEFEVLTVASMAAAWRELCAELSEPSISDKAVGRACATAGGTDKMWA